MPMRPRLSVQELQEREEELFYLPPPQAAACRERIRQLLRRKVFAGNRTPTTSTLYLNNDDHEMPWWLSLKLRRYLTRPSRPLAFSPRQGYYLDVKFSRDVQRARREKGRYAWRGGAALEFVNHGRLPAARPVPALLYKLQRVLSTFPLSQPLRVYTGVEYRREHYVTADAKVRVTVDGQLTYYEFPNGAARGRKLGSEEGMRVELKCALGGTLGAGYRELRRTLTGYGAVPVISKKYNSYNLLSRETVLRRGQRLVDELPEREIEAKLLINSSRGSFFLHDIRQKFEHRLVPGFALSPSFPYVLETGNTAEYYARRSVAREAIKFMYKGQWAQVVVKEGLKVVGSSFTFPIVYRHERKPTGYVPLAELDRRQWLAWAAKGGSLRSVGDFFRARKAFWVDNVRTGRTYHLSLDYCAASRSRMSEVEVEYSGRYPAASRRSSQPEGEIIEDIGYLVSSLLRFYGRHLLAPTTLTKFQWLSRLGRC